MKRFTLVIFALITSSGGFAHDEGHGPKLSDPAKQGGIVSSVIDAKDAKLGAKATLVHKGELVRNDDGTVRLYLYDMQMMPLKLDSFEKNAKAVLTAGRKAKKLSFDLKLEGDAFVGKAPKPPKKPFNIDVTLKEGDKNLLVAFDNLD